MYAFISTNGFILTSVDMPEQMIGEKQVLEIARKKTHKKKGV